MHRTLKGRRVIKIRKNMTIGFEEISFSNVCLILKALEEICDLGEGKLKKIFKFLADSLYS